jgi:hypothetical protein
VRIVPSESASEVEHETHIGDNGLWIPPELREFTGQVVFRTPRATIQHFQSGGGDLEPYYGMIDESHFGAASMFRDLRNPDLVPNRVLIKPRGEEPTMLSVDVDPDLRCDGGQTVSEVERAYYAEGSQKHHFREDCPHLERADGPVTSEVIRAPDFDAVPHGVSRRSPCQHCLDLRGGDQ